MVHWWPTTDYSPKPRANLLQNHRHELANQLPRLSLNHPHCTIFPGNHDSLAVSSDHGLCAGDALSGFDLGQNGIQLVQPRLLQGLPSLKGKGGLCLRR